MTKIPGNDEVVQHGLSGFVGETEKELTPHLEALIDSAEKRQQMGQQAKKYTEENFSLPAMAEQYKIKYQQIADALANG